MSQFHELLVACASALAEAQVEAGAAAELLDEPLSPVSFLHRDISTALADCRAIHDLYYEVEEGAANGDEHAGLAANPEADDAGGTTGMGTDDDEAMREQGANHGV